MKLALVMVGDDTKQICITTIGKSVITDIFNVTGSKDNILIMPNINETEKEEFLKRIEE